MSFRELVRHSRHSSGNGKKVQFKPTLSHAPGARITVVLTNSLKIDWITAWVLHKSFSWVVPSMPARWNKKEKDFWILFEGLVYKSTYDKQIMQNCQNRQGACEIYKALGIAVKYDALLAAEESKPAGEDTKAQEQDCIPLLGGSEYSKKVRRALAQGVLDLKP